MTTTKTEVVMVSQNRADRKAEEDFITARYGLNDPMYARTIVNKVAYAQAIQAVPTNTMSATEYAYELRLLEEKHAEDEMANASLSIEAAFEEFFAAISPAN